jgi:Cu/Ag efflux pump CusA
MILGIATRNGLIMISHYQHLEMQEGETFGPGLILRGSRERFAPILMTALTTGLVLLPFVLFGNIPGHEIVRPMAIVVLGGLVTSTLLNLFILPVLYLRFGASRQADFELHSTTPGDVMAGDVTAGD